MRPSVISAVVVSTAIVGLGLGQFVASPRMVTVNAVEATTALAPASHQFNEIGAPAEMPGTADGLSVVTTATGARLRAVHQKLEANVTADGLSVVSTASGGGTLTIRADRLGRGDAMHPLPAIGSVTVRGDVVSLARGGFQEEFSTGVDGVRQDFIIAKRPAGEGALAVELALNGATAAQSTAAAATLTLAGSERALVYSRLHVFDANGTSLTARFNVRSGDRLGIEVDDATAVYPVRIDPTFSDAHWVSLNGDIAGVDATVRASVVDADGNVYIGGNFLLAGSTAVNRIAKWDPTTSTWAPLGTGMNGQVNALALAGDGSLYAAGAFTTAGGVPANRVARWDPVTSTWSALGSGLNNTGLALAADGSGNVYVGGAFTTAGGVTAVRIAKWNGSAWSPLGPGLNSTPNAMVFDASGNLFVGGAFTATQGGAIPLSRVAKWTPATSTWSPLGSGVSFSSALTPAVGALALDGGGNLFVGGGFDTAGGVAAANVAVWNGATWSALGGGAASTIQAMAFDSGGSLYVGGWFGGHIAKWNGSTWSAVGAGTTISAALNGPTWALAAHGNDVYVGGDYISAGSVPAMRIAKWSGSTSQWSPMGAGTDGEIYASLAVGSDLYVGGSFTRIGGVSANHVAKWDGNAWSPLGGGLNSSVNALTVIGTDVYAGGTFTLPTKHLARWDGVAWLPMVTSVSFNATRVTALAAIGTDLYVGGFRLAFMGAGRVPIGKFDTTLGTWSPLGSGLHIDGLVLALATAGNDLYVGGGVIFSDPGLATSNFARWSGGAWSTVGPGLNNQIRALATIGTDVYAGGFFSSVVGGTTAVPGVAKWDGTAWSPLGAGLNNVPYALVASGTDLYAGGLFTTAGGLSAPSIAKWNGGAWSAMGTGTNGNVQALARDTSGHLFVGGNFGVAGTTVSPMIVQATLDPPPTAVAGIDQFVAATSAGGATATLDASASSDPEGDPLTYVWRNEASTIVGTSAVVATTVPFGVQTYTLTVTDSHGNTASDTVVITVEDVFTITVTTPPVSGASYTFGQSVAADYTCTDSAGIIASCAGPVAIGADIDTANLGLRSFEVTGTNSRGDTSSVTTFYTVTQGASSTIVTCPVSVTYSGTAQTPCTVSVTGPGGLSLVPTPSYASNTTVGAATASYTFAGDAAHAGSSGSAGFVIDNAALSVTANDKTRADLAPNPVFDGEVIGAAPADGITATYTAMAGTQPGTFAIVPSLVDPNNRLGNYTVTIHNGTLTVTDTQPPVLVVPADLTAEATSADGAAVVFDELVSAFDTTSGPAGVSCLPASGSTFALGTSVVTCLAQDATGNVGGATFNLLVHDTTPPALTTTDITVIATQPSGFVVEYSPVGVDAVSGEVTSVCSPTSGTTFMVGSTAVSCSATDDAGNVSATSVFQVVVLDGVAPVVHVPVVAPVEAASASGAIVSFAVTASDNFDATATPNCSPLSGTLFGLGTTTVTCLATDIAGNNSSATFGVTVQDTTAPTLTLPGGVSATVTSGTSTAVTYAASATDLVDGTLAPVCTPASGASFPIGSTNVHCAVADVAGNAANGTFAVTVNDGVAPVVTVSPVGDRVVEATAASGAVVTFTAAATDNYATSLTTVCAPLSGSTFPLGATSVTCQATDQDGNVGLASFTVTVADTTPPVLSLPLSVNATAASASGAPVNFVTSAQDLVDGSRVVTCAPASGSTFPVGSTTVNCNAADTRGNVQPGSFAVTVTLAQSGIEKFVAFSRDSTVLRAGATVTSGDIGANERRLHAHRRENDDTDDGDKEDVTVRVGQRAVMQQPSSRVVGDVVRLLNRASVHDVIHNFLINRRGTVLGSVTGTMPLPLLALPVFPVITPGTLAKEVAKNGTLTLGPGSYGAVRVAQGGTLILTGGLYQLRSLDLAQNATVRFKGATQMRIKTELGSGAKARLILDQTVAGLGASQIVIYVEGSDTSCAHNEGDDDDDHGPAAVHIGQSNVVQANIYSASGTIWLKSKTQATGAFIGNHVRIGQNVTLTLDSAFR